MNFNWSLTSGGGGGVALTGNQTIAGNKSFTGTTTFGSASKYAYFGAIFGEIGLLFHNTVATDFGFYAYSDGVLYGADTTYGDAIGFNLRANGNRITLLGSTAHIVPGGSTVSNLGSASDRFASIFLEGDVVLGGVALATTATAGFTWLPSCSGTPTGVPTSYTGSVASVYDTAANKLWIYNGSWRSVTLA